MRCPTLRGAGASAWRSINANVSAGFMVVSGSEYLVTGRGRMRTPEDVGETVVVAENGVPIRVADLGAVRIDIAPKRGEGSFKAHPAVILGIQKQPGANTLTLTSTLEAVLNDLQAKLPAGMQITHVKSSSCATSRRVLLPHPK